MFKNIQSKIILIILISGLIIIGVIGVRNLLLLNNLNNQVATINNQDLVFAIEQAQNSCKITLAVAVIAFIGVVFILKYYLSKFAIYPLNRLIKSAGEISSKDDAKKSNKKENLENVDDIFGMMTTELKEQLNDVSTKKNQIETILRNMTDGIVAFNMKNEIILINPEAKKLLSIGPEDNTFEDIFDKFNLDINMEKIIYLENWTSTEQRVQVNERYINIFFAPFRNQDDRPDGVIAVVQDITEHEIGRASCRERV